MRRRKTIYWRIIASVVGGVLLLSPFINNTLAQEKKRKKFGSSLKRLKWDAQKGAAVDKETGEEIAKTRFATTADQDVFRIDTLLVGFDLLVVDRQGYAINGLTKEDFIVKEDDVVQQVSTLTNGDDAGLSRSIVLILDHSASQKPFLPMSIAAAKTLVEQIRPNDKMAIVSDDVELLQDFTNDKKRLKSALVTMQNRVLSGFGIGFSRQYSALFAVLQELLIEAERPIIIFQTDGDELTGLQNIESSTKDKDKTNFSLSDLMTAARRERVTIYSVIPGVQLMGLSTDEQMKRLQLENKSQPYNKFFARKFWEKTVEIVVPEQETLAKLAAASGGWHEFLEHPEQSDGIYERILKDINRRYIIAYYPTNDAQDGTLRKVRFEIRNHPEYVIIGRRSYYALQQ